MLSSHRTDDLIERPQVEARHKEASSLIGARAPYKITLPNGEVRPVCSAEEQAHAEEILARRRAATFPPRDAGAAAGVGARRHL